MKEKMLIEYGLKTGAVELTKKYLIMYSWRKYIALSVENRLNSKTLKYHTFELKH